MSIYKAKGLNTGATVTAVTATELVDSIQESHRLCGQGHFSVFSVRQIDNGKTVDTFNLETNGTNVFRGWEETKRYGKES